MKRDRFLNILFGSLYYVLGILFFFYLYIFGELLGNISDFSKILFYAVYIILPILIMILPVIRKFILKEKFYKSILYSCLAVVIYIFVLLGLNFGIKSYFKTFTTEKWSNRDWYSYRYLMIDDLEEKYNFIGMSKEEVYDILGKTDEGVKESGGEYVIAYPIKNGFFEGDYYQIYFDKNDVVTKVNTVHWD